MKNRLLPLMSAWMLIALLVSGCGSAVPATETTPPITIETAVADATAADSAEVVTTVPTEAPAAANEDPNALPPDPQAVTITTSDGRTLEGYYYPSAHNPAPLVVLMHWMQGDKNDWNEIAVWLQNRGQKNPFPNPGDPAKFRWWDPSWFPAVPTQESYAVLTFTYRDCLPFDQGGCATIDEAGRLLDSKEVMAFARGLEGIDPQRIVAVGSSIGADGAADGCLYLNQQFPGSCQGSFSLSPGDWLGVSYASTVAELGTFDPPVAAWCVADENEFPVCQGAEGVGNAAYEDYLVEGGSHGNMLLSPDLDPLAMQLILDFLEKTVISNQ